MNIRKREERNKKIIEFLETEDENGLKPTVAQAAEKFDLSLNQIFRIKKQHKESQEQSEQEASYAQ